VAGTFGETIREMRQAQQMGLRTAADRLGISPAYLSRIERGKERPPKPDLVKRLTTLLGGDPDQLFRLAESTDPDLAEYVHSIPNVPEFLRTAKAMKLTSEDFAVLIEHMKRRRPSETVRTNRDIAGRFSRIGPSVSQGRHGPACAQVAPEENSSTTGP